MIRKYIQNLMLTGLLLVPFLVIAPTQALSANVPISTIAKTEFSQSACDGVSQTGGGGSCDENGDAFKGIFKTVVDIITLLVGILAVIMIVVSGFKYIASGGDSNKVGSAKNTLIYALIGLALAALAKVIVSFVLANAK